MVSRQRQWQLKMREEGKCVACGSPSDGKCQCPACREKFRLKRLAKNPPRVRGRKPQPTTVDESSLP
jgi:hypothetical protein